MSIIHEKKNELPTNLDGRWLRGAALGQSVLAVVSPFGSHPSNQEAGCGSRGGIAAHAPGEDAQTGPLASLTPPKGVIDFYRGADKSAVGPAGSLGWRLS